MSHAFVAQFLGHQMSFQVFDLRIEVIKRHQNDAFGGIWSSNVIGNCHCANLLRLFVPTLHTHTQWLGPKRYYWIVGVDWLIDNRHAHCAHTIQKTLIEKFIRWGLSFSRTIVVHCTRIDSYRQLNKRLITTRFHVVPFNPNCDFSSFICCISVIFWFRFFKWQTTDAERWSALIVCFNWMSEIVKMQPLTTTTFYN